MQILPARFIGCTEVIFMGYRITYGDPVPAPYPKQDKPSRLRLMTAAWFFAFIVMVRLFFPAGSAQLRAYLLPDPQNITQSAVDTFMYHIRNGEQLGDALFAFCHQIISNEPAL